MLYYVNVGNKFVSANRTLSIFYLNNTKESVVIDVALAFENITATAIKIFNEKAVYL